LALLERQVRQLRRTGAADPLLLVPADLPDPIGPGAFVRGGVTRVAAGETDPFRALVSAVDALPQDFLFLSADRLVDARVLAALAARAPSVFACVDGGPAEPIGRVTAADVLRYGTALTAHANRLPLESLDAYHPELRGEVPPYIVPVRSAVDRQRAWGILLDHTQKRALDLPGEYLDSPFENFLVRRLAPTRVTPNQVTLVTILLAGGVGVLFLRGWLRTAVLLALVVGVLDGVDGKLARLKIATSRIGALEHVADFFYENFWYLAIAAYLARAHGAVQYWHAGVLLVLLDLTDNLLYLAVRVRTGRVLDELSPFDLRFRRVAGRRNVYVVMLAGGAVAGYATKAFLAVVVWAGVTVAVHAVRAVFWLRLSKVARAVPQISEIEPAAGVLLSQK
jgi:phosphatidylglycerophosphate synthase